jgi:hypothetical protein
VYVDRRRPVGDRLVRDYFARATGFVIDDLIEVRPPPSAKPSFAFVSPEWAQLWPSEEIWIAHKAS